MFLLRRIGSCAMVLLGSWATLPAQVQLMPIAYDGQYYPSPSTRGLVPAVQLNGQWQLSGPDSGRVRVPFTALGRVQMQIQRQVQCPTDSTRDTLFLYCEGVVGAAAVYWDGRLVHHQSQPHGQWRIALAPALLRGRQHTLAVHLWQATADDDGLGLPPSLGLHKPLYLLGRVASDSLRVQLPALRRTADSCLHYTPYTAAYGWHVPSQLFGAQLAAMQQAGVRGLHFTHPPGSQLLALMAAAGMQWYQGPADGLCAFLSHSPAMDGRAWLSSQGQRTATYGKWDCMGLHAVGSAAPVSRYVLLALGLVVALALVVWKMTDANNFAWHFAWQTGRSKAREFIATNRLYRPLQLLLLSVLRYFLLASFAALMLHYWQLLGQPLVLPMRSTSVLAQVLHTQPSIFEVSWLLLRVLLAYHLIKFLLLELVQRTYRQRHLAEQAFALELYGSFPFLPLCLLMALLVGVVAQAQLVLWYVGVVLACSYVLRRQWVLLTGLRTAQRMPMLAIVLYICTLEFLPWLWVLY